MAVLLDDALVQYLYRSESAVTNEPFTLGGWFYTNDAATEQVCVCLGRDGAAFPAWSVLFTPASAGQNFRIKKRHSTGTASASGATVYALNTWYHIVGVFAADDDRKLYINGVLETSTTTSGLDGSVPNQFEIGARKSSSVANPLSGGFAEVFMYDVALTVEEIACLAKYYSPEHIRPGNRRAYVRGIGRAASVRDEQTGQTFTHVGSFTRVDHVPIRYSNKGEAPRSKATLAPITPAPCITAAVEVVAPAVVFSGITVTPDPCAAAVAVVVSPLIIGLTRAGLTWPFIFKRVHIPVTGVSIMSVSTYSGNALVNLITKNTAWPVSSTRYLALFTAVTGLADNSLATSAEVNTGGYSRLQVEGATGRTFSTSAALAASNQQDWLFATATGSWGTITHIALVDSSTILGGNVVAWGVLQTARPISNGDTFRVLTGDLDVLITNV